MTSSIEPNPIGDDGRAIEAWYRRSYRNLVGLAVLMTGSVPVAEDLVQDSFVRCRHHLDGVADPAAYLRVAVANACRSWHRHRAVEERLVERLAERPIAEPPEPTAAADLMALHGALQGLAEPQRAVLVMRYFADLDDREIASVLGCRPATVRTRAHRALNELRKVMTDDR